MINQFLLLLLFFPFLPVPVMWVLSTISCLGSVRISAHSMDLYTGPLGFKLARIKYRSGWVGSVRGPKIWYAIEMDEYVEMVDTMKGDEGTVIGDLRINLKSSSEDEKLILISNEEEKGRSSSEEDKYEGTKRQNSDREEYEERKRQKRSKAFPKFDYYPDAYNAIEDSKMNEPIKPIGEVRKFTKRQFSRMRVNPEEFEIELTDEEKRYYFNEDDYQGLMKTRRANSYDYQDLRRTIKESEGFDVPFLPWLSYHGTHRTNLTIAEDAIRVARCAKCALKFYNEENVSDFSLVRLVSASTKPCAGKVYRITFKATSPSTGYTETFQTKAFVRWTGDVEIMIRIQNEYDHSRVTAQTGHVYKLSTIEVKKVDLLAY